MPGSDLELLTEAARESGEIARRFWKRAPDTWHKAEGAGPVTEADMAIDAMLHDKLRAARPDYGWLSEETEDDPARLAARRVFIIDPIDGTRAFIEGSRDFAHSLAIAEDGEITAAVIYLPMRDRMFTASRNDPEARLNGRPIHARTRAKADGATVLAAKCNFRPEHWPGGLPPVKPAFRSSIAYRLALVGEGRFDAMLTLRPTWEWDIAAGSLIAQKAGAVVTDLAGRRPRFNRPEPRLDGLIAAAPPLHETLRQGLRG